MVWDIIKNVEPINEVKCKPPRIAGKRKRESKNGPLAVRFYRNYLNPNGQEDKTFGIRSADGQPVIGDKPIDIVGDNIVR